MAEQFYTILTAIGKAKFANSSALGTKLNLTQFAVGDSNGKYYNPTETQASLVNEVWRGNIGSISIDTENPNWIVIEVTIPSLNGGFMIREGGIFDIDGDLIAIAKYPETYKPVAADGSTKDLVIRMILEVSNTSSVTLKLDPTVILATKKDILDIRDYISEHEGKVASTTKSGHVKLNNTLTSTSSTEALTAAQGKVLKDELTLQKAEIVKKPVSAIGNNVAIFDTNQDKIKDSGFTIGKSIPSDAEFTDTIYVHPATHPASIIAVEDAGNIITANNVEGALQEVATNIKSNSDEISNHNNLNASTTKSGHVKLNNTLISDSTEEALTAAQGKALKDELNIQKADNMYQIAGGTATAITLSIKGTLLNGYPINFLCNSNNNGNATTINKKALYKANTNIAPNLVTGKAYTVWYNSTQDCFFIKASAEGNVAASEVLAGKTFSNDDHTGIVGTMPYRGSMVITPSENSITIPQGYHTGSGYVKGVSIKQNLEEFFSFQLSKSYTNILYGGEYLWCSDKNGYADRYNKAGTFMGQVTCDGYSTATLVTVGKTKLGWLFNAGNADHLVITDTLGTFIRIINYSGNINTTYSVNGFEDLLFAEDRDRIFLASVYYPNGVGRYTYEVYNFSGTKIKGIEYQKYGGPLSVTPNGCVYIEYTNNKLLYVLDNGDISQNYMQPMDKSSAKKGIQMCKLFI